MPIHDQSYRRYGGGKARPGGAWQVIAAAGVRTMLRKRAFLGVLLFAWGPFIARAVHQDAPQASDFRIDLNRHDWSDLVRRQGRAPGRRGHSSIDPISLSPAVEFAKPDRMNRKGPFRRWFRCGEKV